MNFRPRTLYGNPECHGDFYQSSRRRVHFNGDFFGRREGAKGEEASEILLPAECTRSGSFECSPGRVIDKLLPIGTGDFHSDTKEERIYLPANAIIRKEFIFNGRFGVRAGSSTDCVRRQTPTKCTFI